MQTIRFAAFLFKHRGTDRVYPIISRWHLRPSGSAITADVDPAAVAYPRADDLVQLRPQADLDFIGGPARRLCDPRDLIAHPRRVIADNHWQDCQRDERDDDEEHGKDHRPGAVRIDAPDAAAFAKGLRGHSP